ncbi:hypothetical protein [Peribacillus saganii]|nr:hypothetical protein [Peribacillus saganii]
MGLFRDSQGHLRDGMGRFASSASVAEKAVSGFGKGISASVKGLTNMNSLLVGAASGFAAFKTAEKGFLATVGAAAQYESSWVTIKAIMNDAKKAKEYMDLVDRFAIDSPIMDSQAMLKNSKSFLTTESGKDLKQLEKMWLIVALRISNGTSKLL